MTEFPVSANRLYNQLGSIGIKARAADIPAKGTENVAITLFPNAVQHEKKALGQSIIQALSDSDTLHDVNAASFWLAEAYARDSRQLILLWATGKTNTLTELLDMTKSFCIQPDACPDSEDENELDDDLEI